MNARFRHQRLLIVEDQQLVRAGIKAMLRMAVSDCEVVEAGSFDEATDRLKSQPFDVTFLDIDLRSDKSGLDVLEFIQSNDLYCRVVMLSGNDDRETVLECINAGACGYIAKGVGDETVFEAALATVLGGGIYLPASVMSHRQGGATEPRSGVPRSSESLGLSPRLCEVLYYVCQGMPNKQIARMMNISEGTVRKNYMTELLRFFGVARRTELIIQIGRRNIIVVPPSHPGFEA